MEYLTNKKKKAKQVFVKPVLSYEQIVEIIDNRISEIDRVSEQLDTKMRESIKKKKSDKQ